MSLPLRTIPVPKVRHAGMGQAGGTLPALRQEVGSKEVGKDCLVCTACVSEYRGSLITWRWGHFEQRVNDMGDIRLLYLDILVAKFFWLRG